MGQIQDKFHNQLAFLNDYNISNTDSERSLAMGDNSSTKMEFAVNMTCESCEDAVRKALAVVPSIQNLTIDVSKQQVVIETTQPSSVIQEVLEETGMIAVLRGQGRTNIEAAISILKNKANQTFGVVRFVQLTEEICVIDSSFNGLKPDSRHTLCLREYGDLSKGAESAGDIYDPEKSTCKNTSASRKAGDLGTININEQGSFVKKVEDNLIKVHDIIGRAVVLHENEVTDEKINLGKGMAFGIVARSAGMFQNEKKVCTCSGKTIWEEREDVRKDVRKESVNR